MKNTIVVDSMSIAITVTGHGPRAVIFVHGNSASKAVFKKQFNDKFLSSHTLIGIDLPGHGESDNALNPTVNYTIRNFAAVVINVIAQLKLTDYIIVGWSLGGHIAIETLQQGLTPKAIVICGTPPVSTNPDELGIAFKPTDVMELTGKESFNFDEVSAYGSAIMGGVNHTSPQILENVARTDGKMRSCVLADFGQNLGYYRQREIVETTLVPIAVFQGNNDVFVSNEYLNSIKWRSLWRHEINYFENIGHAPFWESPNEFNQRLNELIDSV